MFIFNRIYDLIIIITIFIKLETLCSANWEELKTSTNLEDYDGIQKLECQDEFCKKELEEIFSNAKSQEYNFKKRAQILPFYETMNKSPCHCEMTYRLMDLGRSAYPRYVHSGLCKKNSCGVLHRCKPQKYKIRILKKKNSVEADMPEEREAYLPESLAEDWVADHVNIVIGCECVPVKI